VTATVPWIVLVPLLGACVAVGFRRLGPALGVASGVAVLAAAAALTRQVFVEGVVRHAVGGWGAPLGIELRADGVGASMVLMTALTAPAITVYAIAYYRDPGGAAKGWRPGPAFWPLWLFLQAALYAVFLSADVFNLYVALEVLTLSAVGLIVLSPELRALSAAMRYLLAAFLGSLGYLFGVALLYAAFGTLDIALLGERLTPGAPAAAALALVTLGLMLKTALFPLHFWLPDAHGNAPAPASAILSALVIKASFYMIVRLWVEVFPAVVSFPAGQMAGGLGALAILWGSLQAIRQHRLKLLVAYSTVSQVGYLFLLLPLAAVPVGGADAAGHAWQRDAWAGGLYHGLSHAFAKASMFMAAGTVMHVLGHDRMEDLLGLARRLPVTVFAFGLSGLTIIGVPPSGGFVAKWLLLRAAVESGQWWWVIVILAGGLLSAGYLFIVLGQALTPPLALTAEPAGPMPAHHTMEWASMALALLALLLGLRAVEALALIEVGTPIAAGPGP
jgi:multicomponent Na+:H+ antiporter subunit D